MYDFKFLCGIVGLKTIVGVFLNQVVMINNEGTTYILILIHLLAFASSLMIVWLNVFFLLISVYV